MATELLYRKVLAWVVRNGGCYFSENDIDKSVWERSQVVAKLKDNELRMKQVMYDKASGKPYMVYNLENSSPWYRLTAVSRHFAACHAFVRDAMRVSRAGAGVSVVPRWKVVGCL